MKLLDGLHYRMAALFRHSQRNTELEEELRSHIRGRYETRGKP